MNSRAHFLLQREFQELKDNDYNGIVAFPVSEDMMEWEADIEGLQDTFWHGMSFQLTINFTPEYNFVPPVVTFRTIPFHPNVDQHTGRPCIDFLDSHDKWNTCYSLSSILLTLQVMLSNPVLKNPVNLEAAQILIKDESMYRQIVLRLFHKPLQLDNDSNADMSSGGKKFKSIKISFDDYYKTWSEIATSKPTEYHRNSAMTKSLTFGDGLDLKRLFPPLLSNQGYPAAVAQYARENKRPYKANYQTERIRLCSTPNSQIETDTITKTDDSEEWKSDYENINEPWEEEVEDLVAWTNTLNTDTLED
ncbi:ubiquitin-conjugating enzyme E2 U [Pteropus vampyrus]|uniref:Ubiquitin-conjugating enzyme E2 U n=1 Tax=Pteropus vampyrus TaxID=132908 RepID=A0A6P6CYK5_PTEVA|nr:ubiquitin-conjugating enzyme E2 U [Pteropus vampyrus]